MAACATSNPRGVSAPNEIAGMNLGFTDLHSANTYEFLPGGLYRFTALSQNGLRTERREGTYVGQSSGRSMRIILDDEEILRLTFESAGGGICKSDGDVREYRFRLSKSGGHSTEL